MLPKKTDLVRNGGVYRQMVRCGKATCRCTRGEMHAAYYFISRSFGRQQKQYIPKSKLKEVREAVESSRELRRDTIQHKRHATKLIRQAREFFRELAAQERARKETKRNYYNGEE